MGVDHLARDHLKMALLLSLTAADVAAIKPEHDGTGRLRRGLRRSLYDVRRHDLLANPQRPVPHRARVRCPADRQQLGQQRRDLAERRQRRIPGRDIGQLWRDSISAEVEDGKARRLTRALTKANEQPSDTDRNIAEQGAERHGVMALAGPYAPTGPA